MQQRLTFPESINGDAALDTIEAQLLSLASNRSGVSRPEDVQPGETWWCTATTAWQLNLWTGSTDLLILVADTFAGTIYIAGIGAAASMAVSTDTTLGGATPSNLSLVTEAAVQGFVAAYVAAHQANVPTNVSVAAKVAGQAMFGGA